MPDRRAGAALLCLAAIVAVPPAAHAGAWTQRSDTWQIISSFDASRAGSGFDAQSHADAPVKFDKIYLKTLAEYGWTDRVTLFLAPEYVFADFAWDGGAAQHARDAAVEGGARVRLTDRFGIVSLQGSFKFAGPFDLSNSIGRASARIAELRLLQGANFKLFGRDGFTDVEVAERLISHPRPNETVFDATAGVWFLPQTMAMLQSFNVISGGDAEPPYTFYRTHKVELSLVQRLSERWSVQLGVYVSPAGQNSLVEQGISAAVWTNL